MLQEIIEIYTANTCIVTKILFSKLYEMSDLLSIYWMHRPRIKTLSVVSEITD